MKVIRSTTITIKYATNKKKTDLLVFLVEYVRVVNCYVDAFWNNPAVTETKHLTQNVVNHVSDTWLTYRARQDAARQALAKCRSTKASFATWKENGDTNKTTCKKPRVRKLKAMLSINCVKFERSLKGSFDAWLHFSSLGNKLNFRLPVKLHSHYHKLAKAGRRCTSFEISEDKVKISFEIDTGKKHEPTGCVGLDTGINALASISTGKQFGTEIKQKIAKIKRCEYGSKGQQRARISLKQYIDLVCKQVMLISGLTLLVIENLKGITKGTKLKGRLSKNMRSSVGVWNVRYFHNRLEQQCEINRVSFRTVPAYYTSQTCPCCGNCQKENRNGLLFKCLRCGYADNADISASKSILNRFLSGKYSAGCSGLADERTVDDMTNLLECLFRQQNIRTTIRKPKRFRHRPSSTGTVRKNNTVSVSKRKIKKLVKIS